MFLDLQGNNFYIHHVLYALLFVNLGQEWGWVEIHTTNRKHILLFQLLGKQAVSCDHEWDLSSESCP